MEQPELLLNALGNELAVCLKEVDAHGLTRLADAVEKGNRVFVAGAGRSGLAVRAFAMRLTHLGLIAHVVGDVTTPAITREDTLLIGSGSGKTPSLRTTAEKAASVGATVVLVTIDRDAPIARSAQSVVAIPAPSPKAAQAPAQGASVQPMGSLFEQALWLVLDAVVILLMRRLGESASGMFARHANLE